MTGYRLAIKNNNCATNDPCALCGARTDPAIGRELFLADSWALVCHECGMKHDPALTRLAQLAYRAEELVFAMYPWLIEADMAEGVISDG